MVKDADEDCFEGGKDPTLNNQELDYGFISKDYLSIIETFFLKKIKS